MKKSLLTLVSFVLILVCFTQCTPKENEIVLHQWMKNICGKTQLCKISIPATHDSGALLGGEALQCQDVTIKEQLNLGIRGFDIRLQAEPNKKLGVYHSIAYQNITWEDNVLPDFIEFLQQNPSETLVVSVKCENNDEEGYAQLLAESVLDAKNTPYWVKDFRPDLTLDECRGKIVLINRSKVATDNYPGALCGVWDDNATFEMKLHGADGTEGIAKIEDVYYHESASLASHKADITFDNMASAMNEPKESSKWFISFASATALPKNGPKDFSDVVHVSLIEKMKGVQKNCGIVLIDFAGDKDARTLTQLLINSNQSLFKK